MIYSSDSISPLREMILLPSQVVPSFWMTDIMLVVVGLAFLLLLLEVFTLGYAFIKRLKDRQRKSVDSRMEELIQDRLREGPGDWGPFINSLSPRERASARRIARSLLYEATDCDAAHLRRLAIGLGLEETAANQIENGDRISRLNGLTSLTLLRSPPSVDMLWPQCHEDSLLRGAAAQALMSVHTETAYRDALTFLFDKSGEELTVLGMEVIYEVGQRAPDLLVAEIAKMTDRLSETELVQVLYVISELDELGVVVGAPPPWLVMAAEEKNARVREAAVMALRSFEPETSNQVADSLLMAVEDENKRVRLAAARTICDWGAEFDLTRLEARLNNEPSERVRQEIVDTLLYHDYRPQRSLSVEAKRSWAWEEELHRIPAGDQLSTTEKD